MASIHRNNRSRFWVAAFRDGSGKLFQRSTKIEIAPSPQPGESKTEHARRKRENERAATSLAVEWEELSRGNRTENQIRLVTSEITRQVTGKAIEWPTAQAFLEKWIEREGVSLSPGTTTRYKTTIRQFLDSLKVNGREAVRLADLRPDDFDHFKASRLKVGIRAATVRADLKSLNVPLNSALRAGLIHSNPIAAIKMPDEEGAVRSAFTDTEIEALLTEAKKTEPEFETAILLSAFAGLRLGDCVTLTWAAINLTDLTLTFMPQKTRRKKRVHELPIHPRIESHLLELSPSDDPDALLCPGLAKVKSSGRSGLSRRFLNLLQRAGIDQNATAGKGKGRTFNARTFHSLRHSFVTRLENAGVAEDIRMKLAGHLDRRSHGTYTHTALNTLRTALEKI